VAALVQPDQALADALSKRAPIPLVASQPDLIRQVQGPAYLFLIGAKRARNNGLAVAECLKAVDDGVDVHAGTYGGQHDQIARRYLMPIEMPLPQQIQ
jgi:hypothetical protein